jgi:transcriptional regulator
MRIYKVTNNKNGKVQYNTAKMHKTLSESANRGWETRRRNVKATLEKS